MSTTTSMPSSGRELTVECELHFDRRGKGARKELAPGPVPEPPPGRIPRVARLLALAHRLEAMVRSGEVRDYAQLARIGRVTRARVSQILSLLCLAPDIQEEVLFLPPVYEGRDPLILADLAKVAAELDWSRQRRLWTELAGRRRKLA